MRIVTTRSGQEEEIEVADEVILHFPAGVIGFEEHKRFALLADGEMEPFVLLQSLADPWIAFVAVDLPSVRPAYTLKPRPDAEAAVASVSEDALVLALVTLADDPEESTINTLAPVVVDRQARTGRQLIQQDQKYSVAEPLLGTDGDTAIAS